MKILAHELQASRYGLAVCSASARCKRDHLIHAGRGTTLREAEYATKAFAMQHDVAVDEAARVNEDESGSSSTCRNKTAARGKSFYRHMTRWPTIHDTHYDTYVMCRTASCCTANQENEDLRSEHDAILVTHSSSCFQRMKTGL